MPTTQGIGGATIQVSVGGVTWPSGASGDYVSIFGVSGLASISKDRQFFRTAPAAAGQFTIPSQVFALLPPAGIDTNLDPGTNFYVA